MEVADHTRLGSIECSHLLAPLDSHEAFACDILCRLSTAFLGTPWSMQHHMPTGNDPMLFLGGREDVKSDGELRVVEGTSSDDANPI
jgi:hypothetical protein